MVAYTQNEAYRPGRIVLGVASVLATRSWGPSCSIRALSDALLHCNVLNMTLTLVKGVSECFTITKLLPSSLTAGSGKYNNTLHHWTHATARPPAML